MQQVRKEIAEKFKNKEEKKYHTNVLASQSRCEEFFFLLL